MAHNTRRPTPKLRERLACRKTRHHALHEVNPPGSKIARRIAKHLGLYGRLKEIHRA